MVDRDGENVTLKALDEDAYDPFNEVHYRFSSSEESVITDHFEIDSTTGQITVLKTLNDLNEDIQVNKGKSKYYGLNHLLHWRHISVKT